MHSSDKSCALAYNVLSNDVSCVLLAMVVAQPIGVSRSWQSWEWRNSSGTSHGKKPLSPSPLMSTQEPPSTPIHTLTPTLTPTLPLTLSPPRVPNPVPAQGQTLAPGSECPPELRRAWGLARESIRRCTQGHSHGARSLTSLDLTLIHGPTLQCTQQQHRVLGSPTLLTPTA